MGFGKNGMIEVDAIAPPQNLYEGQKNTSTDYVKAEKDYKTDVFRDYGFDSCLKLSPASKAVADTKFMAYSYLTNPSTVYGIGETFTATMYAYVSEDCNADFKLILEHGCTLISTTVTRSGNGSISDIKGKVFFVSVTFTANSTDGKIYLMFYPNTNQTNVFTKGYQLIAGINIYKGSQIYLPSYDGGSHGIYSIPDSKQIGENNIAFDDFIEY